MNLNDYQHAAVGTAIYPEQYKVAYPALGLIGELCEAAHAVVHTPKRDIVLKELGDIMWYCSALAGDLDAHLEDLGWKLSDTAAPPRLVDIGWAAEAAKKLIRDSSTAKRVLLLDFITYAMGYVATTAHNFESSIEEVMEMNLAKLRSRKERGVLQGDGDNR